MPSVADPSAFFLLPLAPVRGLKVIRDDLDRLITLDPKLAESARLLEERLRAAVPEEQIASTLGPLLWLQLRDQFKAQRNVDALRVALGNGGAMLRTVERLLDTRFAAAALEAAVAGAGQLSQPESAAAGQLDAARSELESLDTTEKLGPAAAIAAALGLAVVVAAAEVALVAAIAHALE